MAEKKKKARSTRGPRYYTHPLIKSDDLKDFPDAPALLLRTVLPTFFAERKIPHNNPRFTEYSFGNNIGFTLPAGYKEKPADDDFGLPPAPPNSPRPQSPVLSNEQYTALKGEPAPLAEPLPEDRLTLRKDITDALGGQEVRKFVENAGLDHVVRVRVQMNTQDDIADPCYQIFPLCAVDTFEKLKDTICHKFGEYLSGYMQQNSSVCICNVAIFYTCNDKTGNRVRQGVGDPIDVDPSRTQGRLYTNRATMLRAEIKLSEFHCYCGKCDGLKDVPEIDVSLKIVDTGQLPTRFPKPRRSSIKYDDEPKKESIIHFNDLLVSKQPQEVDQVQSHDHAPKVLINAEFLQDLLNDRHRLPKLKKTLDEYKLKGTSITNSRLRHRRNRPIVRSSSSDSTPIKKRPRMPTTKSEQQDDDGEWEDQEADADA